MITTIIKIVLIVMAVFLVVAVLLQEGKSQGLGALEGNTESYLGKGKSKKSGKKLSKLTTIIAIVFVVVILVLGIFEQRNGDYVPDLDPEATITDSSFGADNTPTPAPTTSAAATTTPDATATGTVAPATTPATTATQTAE